MYAQFQNPIASAAKWIFFGLFMVVLMGFLLGTNFKDATWLKGDIAAAEAERIQIENAYKQEIYNLQIRLAAAKTEAEIKEIQLQQALLAAQYQDKIEALKQDRTHGYIAFRTWMNVLTIFANASALALFVIAVVWASARAWVYVQSNSRKEQSMAKTTPPVTKWIPNLPEREPYDPWDDREYRRQRIAAARDQERKEREENKTIAARIRRISNAEQVSKNEYHNLPLASD